jgi:hypothetical protein
MSETTTAPATETAEAAIATLPASSPVPFVPRQRKVLDLTTITAISFSLTFVGVSLMLLAGVMPQSFAALEAPVDIGVLLLIVPLCALVLAMMAEVLRAAVKGAPPKRAPRNASTLISEWRPGHGEG